MVAHIRRPGTWVWLLLVASVVSFSAAAASAQVRRYGTGITVYTNPDFTGDTQDTVSGEYDTPNREQHPGQGRWISPDPILGDLSDPQALLDQLTDPLSAEVLGALGPLAGEPGARAAGVVKWEARNDWVKIGSTSVRVYRVQARFLDRYQVVVCASRIGEILRVELPGDVTLVNEQLAPSD